MFIPDQGNTQLVLLQLVRHYVLVKVYNLY